MAKATKKTTRAAATKGAAKKAAKKGAAKRAATERKAHPRILDNMRITLTAKGKEGGGRRGGKSRTGKVYGYYKNGMSVEAFLAKPDARRVDVLADYERGNITLKPTPTAG